MWQATEYLIFYLQAQCRMHHEQPHQVSDCLPRGFVDLRNRIYKHFGLRISGQFGARPFLTLFDPFWCN